MTNVEYERLCDPSTNWSCLKCLFPGVDSPAKDTGIRLPTGPGFIDSPMVTPTIKLSRGLKIAHLNVNRLLSKIHSLRDLLETHRFDVLTVSETWLTSNILNSEISIKGYHTARRDRSHSVKSRGGGSLIYVRNGIQFTVKDSFSTTGSECLWIEVTRKFCKPLFICSVYRPEEHKIDDFIVDLENGLNQVPDRAEVCLLGDFYTWPSFVYHLCE